MHVMPLGEYGVFLFGIGIGVKWLKYNYFVSAFGTIHTAGLSEESRYMRGKWG